MSLNIDIEEWKKGIPQRELEQKIREYEEDYPKREKMTPQARENNQTRFFLEDRFYELHKQQLADMLKKQAEGNVLFGFGTDNQGIIPIAKDSSSEGYASSGKHALSSSYSGGEQGGAYSGRGLDSANTGLEASALTPASYGATGGNGGQQLAGGYGNGYTADYVQPAVAAEKGQSMLPGGMTPTTAREMMLFPDIAGTYMSNLNDINKHQYVACRIAQTYGPECPNQVDEIVKNIGIMKEYRKDIPTKLKAFYEGGRSNYKTVDEIYADTDKDMTNNYLGAYFAKKEAERLGGYQNIDCSPLKQSALGGSFLNNKYGGQSENKLKKIAQEEKNPIPLDFFNYPQYDDVHVRHA